MFHLVPVLSLSLFVCDVNLTFNITLLLCYYLIRLLPISATCKQPMIILE